MIIGIDDTDSRKGMCTTYLCAVLVDELKKYGGVSTPRLVRLNPCIPFKTRGNGAVSFEIWVTEGKAEKVKEVVKDRVSELSELREEGTNPGVVFIDDNILNLNLNLKLKNFYENAVREVLTLTDAYAIISELHFDYFGLKNKRGLIGALAAASFLVLQKNKPDYYDFTYELMAYRQKERWGKSRFIDETSVWKADAATYPLTWDTVDVANNEIVFAPHSPCPVLFGIRGDSVDAIYKTYELIDTEPEERKMLFVTNQGTDFHLTTFEAAREKLRDYHSYILDGMVSSNPRTIEGGHVVFSILLSEETLGSIECIAYEPTKGFRDIIRKLRVGDEITVFGSLKKETLNLEKIEVRKLNLLVERNPRCDKCGRTMKSAGRLQGYRCKRCGTFRAAKDKVVVDRELEEGLYEVPPVARRHISKPLIRMRMQKEGAYKAVHPSR
uniref:tRNA(Ile2) 2-agmatinylcytidine synthetase TiaS n=1 Tax=Candidatus Methanophagaceae archaeon ANME-1 ERB6 TaxID=2759912 RepID=A0A7G9YWL9_9EURY|nr:tRNA(Ile2) 2-agmatinylcytidine synthetase TiaS [Methanosarcinales archaeon ANME-1 ERB6]